MNADYIRTNCPRDCYDNCGIIVEPKDDGRLRVLGDPDHPVSRGRLCRKCALAYNGVWQDEAQRLLKPLKRVGPKGSDRYTAVSWDQAVAEIATRLNSLVAEHGGSSLLHTHYSGTLSLLAYLFPNRFFNYLGASEVDPDTICNAAGHTAWTLMFGNSVLGIDPRTARDSACIFVWGANPAHSAPHAHEYWLPESPAAVVVIDPLCTETAAAADLHLRPRPGTDAALAFALLHALKSGGHFDSEFIATHTVGYEQIQADIERCTPSCAAELTGVAATDIERAAEFYARGPAILWAGQGLQRQPSGGNIMRAIGLLPALTGNIGKPGAGITYLNVAALAAGIDLDGLAGADLVRSGGKSVSHMDLAARLADPEEFKALMVWNTNPVASAPEQAQLREALTREDLFTVVIDCFATDTAMYADFILPAASFLEFDDLTFSYFHMHMGVQSKAREPLGEALPNQEIFRRLAQAMELDEAALFESDPTLLAKLMEQMDLGLDFAALQRQGYIALGDEPLVFFADGKFDTASGRIEIASEPARELGAPLTPQPTVDAAPRCGRWRLLTPASKWFLNDSYANDAHILEQVGETTVFINPEDGLGLGIESGAQVRLANEAGQIEFIARLDPIVQPGVLLTYKGRWPRLEAGANVNVLHRARHADFARSTTVHATEVSIEVVTPTGAVGQGM